MVSGRIVSGIGRPRMRTVAAVLALGALLSVGLGVGPAFAESFLCDVDDVAVYTKPLGLRLHARCAVPAPGGIAYFALDLKRNKVAAPLVLQLLNTALDSNKDVWISYDASDLSGAKIGCQPGDCRLLQAAEMLQ